MLWGKGRRGVAEEKGCEVGRLDCEGAVGECLGRKKLVDKAKVNGRKIGFIR